MRVNQINSVSGAGPNSSDEREQKRFDGLKTADQKFNESTHFMRERGESPENAKKYREMVRQMGRASTFKTILDGEMEKYKK